MAKKLINALIQSQIVNISRICDLICVQFETTNRERVFLHIQSFFRIIKGKKIILCSEDMYKCGKKADQKLFEWDIPGDSIFDENLIDKMGLICQCKLLGVRFAKNGDMVLSFDNDMTIQVMMDTTCIEEKYRIFDEKVEIIKKSG